MDEHLESAAHLSPPAQVGLYARPDVPWVRGYSVLAIVWFSFFPVVIGVPAVASWFVDPIESPDFYESRWIFLIGFIVCVVASSEFTQDLAWRIAVLRLKIPIVALVREGSGLAVTPVRYLGRRVGRVRVTETGPRVDKHPPLVLRRGDEVRISIKKLSWSFGRGSRADIRLRIDAPNGDFRSKPGLWASELDLEGFESLLRSEGISIVLGPLAG